MKTMSIHHASHPDFNVENYDLVDVLDLQPEFGGRGGYCDYLKRGGAPCKKVAQCSHCGAHLRYAAVMRHESTGDHIMIGETCLNERFSGAHEDFAARREAAIARANQARKVGKLELFLAENPDFRELTEDSVNLWDKYGEFVDDVISKLLFKGELSENQTAAVRKVIERKKAWAAQRAQEAATMSQAPSGRVTFEGTIASVKLVDDSYGYGRSTTMKLLVIADGNYKVWVTAPSALRYDEVEPAKGRRVKLCATLTPSAKDATFAIGKRPILLTA